jgi:hypothetical protein
MARSISDETDPQNTVNGVVLNELAMRNEPEPKICDKIMIPSVQDVADLEPWPGCQVKEFKILKKT